MNSKALRSPTISLLTAIAACSLFAGNVNAQSGSKSRSSSTQSRTTTPGSSSKSMMSKPMSGSRSASVSIALDGYCPVCILEIKKWVKGKNQYFVDVDNKRYLFPDEKTRAMFIKNSAKYTPALNGDCVVCYVEGKTRAPGSVHHASFHDGRLFLFPSADEKAKFMSSPKKYENADLALGGMCSVCRVEMQKDVPGKAEFGTFFMGKRYYFPGADQMKMFNANPKKYVEK